MSYEKDMDKLCKMSKEEEAINNIINDIEDIAFKFKEQKISHEERYEKGREFTKRIEALINSSHSKGKYEVWKLMIINGGCMHLRIGAAQPCTHKDRINIYCADKDCPILNKL